MICRHCQVDASSLVSNDCHGPQKRAIQAIRILRAAAVWGVKRAMTKVTSVPDPIPFIDLQAQRKRLGEPLMRAIHDAVEGGQWILGPQVAALEQQLAAFAGVKHAVACANGTDALLLILKAWNIGPGDAVFVPSFTFAATAEVVALAGATPVFVDVLGDTFNMDPASLEAAIAMVRRDAKLTPKAVMPVDLFGQPADYRKMEPIAKREGPADAVRYGASFRRHFRWQAHGRHRRCGGDQLLSGKAARLLWRWRRVFHQ